MFIDNFTAFAGEVSFEVDLAGPVLSSKRMAAYPLASTSLGSQDGPKGLEIEKEKCNG
jgi:hypothetical protein